MSASESSESGSPYPPHATLVMRGKELDPERITDSLQITPHRAYRKGDKWKGNQDRPHGFWMLTSSEEISDLDLMVHVRWLMAQIEPVQDKLLVILKDKRIKAAISCLWIMPSSHESLSFDPALLRQLAALNISLELDIHGPH